MLKLGMFVDVNFGGAAATSGQATVSVPRGAACNQAAPRFGEADGSVLPFFFEVRMRLLSLR
jgi:hypothetical protein